MYTMEELKLTEEARAAVERVGQEFLASIYGVAAARDPEDIAVLAELGHVYTHLGRYQDGLEVDAKLVEAAPDDPTVRYNLACSQALLGQSDDALETLQVALDLGYDDVDFMREDGDLASLHDDPRFHDLLARIAG